MDIKPTNMEELTEVITAAEFHPVECNLLVYSSSKGTIRLCDMRAAALCDRHSKLFEEPEDPTNRSFFSEIISSISDVKLSNSGRYMISRDYLSVKVWDLHMETKPIECYHVSFFFHSFIRNPLHSRHRIYPLNFFARILSSFRFTITSGQNCARCTRTTASLTSLSVVGAGMIRPS